MVFFVFLSRPEIALHNLNVMKEEREFVNEKRSQKDYSMSFKLDIVKEIESGALTTSEAVKRYGIQSRSTVVDWLRKFGNFDWENQRTAIMPKSQERNIMELEQKVKLLEKQKALLEKQVEQACKKSIIFDIMIDLAEKEYNIPIRKNSLPEQSIPLRKNTKKA